MRSAGRRPPFEHATGLNRAPAASAATSFPPRPPGIERMTSGNRPWSAINPGTGHQQAVATVPKAGADLEGQPALQARVVEFKGNCDFGDAMPLGKFGRSQRQVFRDT